VKTAVQWFLITRDYWNPAFAGMTIITLNKNSFVSTGASSEAMYVPPTGRSPVCKQGQFMLGRRNAAFQHAGMNCL
jgi:hypothetical protein